MKCLLVLGCFALSISLAPAASEPSLSAAALLDEAIQHPGNFSQICDAGKPLPFRAPPIPAFGLSVSQTLFPSVEMIQRLKERREEIVKEMESRLDKLDWLHPPPAPAVRAKPLFPSGPRPPGADGNPDEASGQNPRALGAIMLTAILELEATEVLPQMLRLEEDLYRTCKKATTDANAPVPQVDLGGPAQWEGMDKEFKGVEDWSKAPPKLKRKLALFNALMFDREMLGVMLELLHRKSYAPLQASTLGRLRAMRLKAKAGEDELLRAIKKPEDLKPGDDGIAFDKDLGIPYWRWDYASLTYSDELRGETRGLVRAYIDGKAPAVPSGEELIDAAISRPGNFSQMCASPKSPPFDVPLPAYGPLVPRHYSLSVAERERLQAFRDLIIPVLMKRIHDLDLSQTPSKPEAVEQSTPEFSLSGQSPKAFSALLLSVVRALHGIETLPELLRLESQLHDSLAAAEKDEKAPLPALKLDSPVRAEWGIKTGEKRTPEEIAAHQRKEAVYRCRIFQRELLGLIAGLLREEHYEPLLGSGIEKAYEDGLREIATKGELKDIKKIDDIPWESHEWIVFDSKLQIPVYRRGSVVSIPYTEALRAEVRKQATDFLAATPPDQWKGAAAMQQ